MKEHSPLTIGERIRNYRKKKRITQLEAAEIIGINISSLNKIEMGKANSSVKTLVKIEEKLGIQLFI